MNIPAAPKPTVPVLLDTVIGEVQDHLLNQLPWLDHAFGRVQRITKLQDGRGFTFPGVHIQDNEYINVLPDEAYGNFCFFDLQDPYEVRANTRRLAGVSAEFALVFWLNLDNVLGDTPDRNTEAVKIEILKALTETLHTKTGTVRVMQVYSHMPDVYRGFSVKEVDSQFLMHPYTGFRFVGDMKNLTGC